MKVLVLELRASGLLEPAKLPAYYAAIDAVTTPEQDAGRVVVLSGRMPLWLAAGVTHHLHPYAGVGIYDPRLEAAVLVSRHVPGLPEEGAVLARDESWEVREVEL